MSGIPFGHRWIFEPYPTVIDAEGRDIFGKPDENGQLPVVYNTDQGAGELETWDETVKKGLFDETFEHPNPINGKEWSENYKKWHRDLIQTRTTYINAGSFYKDLRENQILMVTAGTGAGKSILVGKLIYHFYAYKKKLFTTMPRQGITQKNAEFVAELSDVECGKEIGYKHGGEKNMAGPDTMFLFTTDGSIKAKMTTSDPDLLEYQVGMLDEVHERNVNIDILLLMMRDLCKRRPDFKLILISATVDVNTFRNYFEKEDLKFKHHHFPSDGKGQSYTIDKHYLDAEIDKKKYHEYMFLQIDKILKNTKEGDIIGFVHTMTPANKIVELLEQNKKSYPGKPCFVAYSSGSSPEETDLVFKFDEKEKKPYYMIKGYTRIVILGTNALEASFTAPGNLVYVVDAGVSKQVWYDPIKFSQVMDLLYVQQSSLVQRQGRTGRTCNGAFYGLYTKEQFDSFPEYAPPSIINSDITNDILGMMNLPMTSNLSKTLEFMSELMTPPTVESIESGVKLLYNYSMINSKGEMTDLGIVANTMGKLGPELTRMVLISYYFGCMEEVVMLAAMMIATQGRGMSAFIREPHFTASYQEKAEYKKKIAKFGHKRGDHFVLINILKAYLMVHPDDRKEWCDALGFRYDQFYKTIINDYNSIKDTLQGMDFPQQFTHFPPPSKPDQPPRDLVEYLKLHNQEMMDQMFGEHLLQDRFNFNYGGGRKTKINKRKISKDPKTFKKKRKELTSAQKDIRIKLKNLQNEIWKDEGDSSRGIFPTVINLSMDPSKSSRFKVDIDENDLQSNFQSNTSSKSIFRSKPLSEKELSKSSDMWSISRSKLDNKLRNKMTHIDNENIRQLMSQIRNQYVNKRISNLKLDKDLKKILTMKPKEFNRTQFKLYNHKNDALINEVDEDNPNSLKYVDPDADFKEKLIPKKESRGQEKFRKEFNESFDESLLKMRIKNPGIFRKTQTKSRKNHHKTHIKKTKQKNQHKNQQKGGFVKNQPKNQQKNKPPKPPGLSPEILEKERVKFGNFIDQISLRTESGILPEYRIFEDKEENILACIFYGFYMRIAVNFYQKKYLSKLARLDAGIEGSMLVTYDKTPSLIVYQSMSINNNKATMGVISELPPRIINAFI